MTIVSAMITAVIAFLTMQMRAEAAGLGPCDIVRLPFESTYDYNMCGFKEEQRPSGQLQQSLPAIVEEDLARVFQCADISPSDAELERYEIGSMERTLYLRVLSTGEGCRMDYYFEEENSDKGELGWFICRLPGGENTREIRDFPCGK